MFGRRRYGGRQGCLSGLLQMFLLDQVFGFMQRRFGFGRGTSCGGLGCGCLLAIIAAVLFLQIITGTDWFRLGF
jgi:hypothetical protein